MYNSLLLVRSAWLETTHSVIHRCAHPDILPASSQSFHELLYGDDVNDDRDVWIVVWAELESKYGAQRERRKSILVFFD